MASPPLLATFLEPSKDVIEITKEKRRRIKRLPIISFTKWKRKYIKFLRILYINYLHESKFTLDEYKNGLIMTFEQFSKHFYRAKLSSSFNPQNNGKIEANYAIPVRKVIE
jgi:hypothetical protein